MSVKTAQSIESFVALLKRDLLLASRHLSEVVQPLLFFTMAVMLFPLGVGPDAELLRIIAAGILWVAALFASSSVLDKMFREDFEDGALEYLLLSPTPLPLLVIAKCLAHWLTTGLPLVFIAPLLGLLLNLSFEAVPLLVLSLLVGTPTISFVGAVGVGLTVGLRRGGVLLTLLVLPLYVPVLIFATGAVQAASQGAHAYGHLLILLSMLVLATTLTPFAAASALRISAEMN
ncbi:MAG TPA: heme exporter protein CcmB [Gammaproteobacteria bacterium]|nr:heme exporter protein CcmB [Gammaproteobacteria bacterium]